MNNRIGLDETFSLIWLRGVFKYNEMTLFPCFTVIPKTDMIMSETIAMV